ncbi:MAG: substrate-binding domain-containing protein [Planctomycetes bacterium]|nr:substrate-binding domain-containing protein [Planctomycetota bacterium]
MRLPSLIAWLSVAALPGLFAGCSDGAEGGSGGDSASGARWRVAVIPKGTSHEFWKAVESGARRADAELADVEIVWKGPAGEGATAAQQTVVENFLADGYHGICLAPLDGLALGKQVLRATSAGVPVVIFDSGLKDPAAAASIASYVATNNYAGGAMAARTLVELIGGQGKVLLLPYVIGSESTEERERGFLEEIAKYKEVVVVAKDTRGGPGEADAIRASESLLQEHGEDLAGIFAPNESNVSGLITVLRRDPRGLAGKVKLVGFDFSPNIVQGLRDGVLHATVLQDPIDMGYRAVKAMRAKLAGEAVEPRIETGLELGTKANMDEPKIRVLLGLGS